jgi:hypothetical protein
MLDWSVLAMGGVYGLGWILVLSVTMQGANPAWAHWILPFTDMFLMHNFAVVLLLIGVVSGWRVAASCCPLPEVVQVECDGFGISLKRWMMLCWVLLLVGVVAQTLYSGAYGGLVAQLEYSEIVRSGIFEVLPENVWSFLQPLSGCVLIAALGFFGLLLSGLRRPSIVSGFLVATLCSLYVLYNSFGRLPFVAFIASLMLAPAIYNQRSPMRLLCGSMLTGVAMLCATYWISGWIELKPADNVAEFVSRELSFPFGSFYGQMSDDTNLFRAFQDIAVTPVFLLPSSMWADWIVPVNQINTTTLMGAAKGHSGVTSGIPVDLVTLGLMQMHLPGILIVGGLFGALLWWVQRLLEFVPLAGIRAAFTASLSLSIACLSIFYSQPNLLIANHIHWILAWVLVWAVVGYQSRRTT